MPRTSDPAVLAAQALAQRNNDAEAVYRAYRRRRPAASKAKTPGPRPRRSRTRKLDDDAWAAAEREARPVRAIGFFLGS